MNRTRHVSTTGAWRLVRGMSVGASASGLGALAHITAGGAAPTLPVLIALALVATGVCVVASRWRWTFASLAAVLLLAQVGFHQAFTVYAGSGPGGGALAAGGTLHHAPHAAHVPWDVLSAVDMSGGMALRHALVAAAIALLLRFGESWLRHVVDVLGLRLARLVTSGWPMPAPTPSALGATAPGFLVHHHLEHDVWSRGPPQ